MATVWLGWTLGCAECHDHKFDPFTRRDFYRLEAFFADIKQWGVYADCGYTPNPELKGWTNEQPFPPEIEVDSPNSAAPASDSAEQIKRGPRARRVARPRRDALTRRVRPGADPSVRHALGARHEAGSYRPGGLAKTRSKRTTGRGCRPMAGRACGASPVPKRRLVTFRPGAPLEGGLR